VDERYARLESAVGQLLDSVESLQQRVAALEEGHHPAAGPAATGDGAGAREPGLGLLGARAKRGPYDPIVMLSMIGRLFLVLAGGFFLRAMTEAGVLAPAAGVALAFLYAGVWLYMADRSGRLGQSSGALFHALGAALVAFPLLLEATTRFKVIGVAGGAFGLVLLTAAFLFVAVRRRLHTVAWVTIIAAIPTALVLLLKTGVAAPFALFLIALGVATMWLAYAYGWTFIRWPVALAADLAVVGVTLRALMPEHAEPVRVVMLLQVVLVAAYLASIAVRTLVRDRNVTLFEVTQAALALVIGFGGAVLLARATATLAVLMGAASILFGTACYALAFWFVGRHEGHERNVQFYAALALVLVLAGLGLDLSPQWLAGVSAVFAVVAVAGWARFGRLYLLLHGVVYLMVAGIASHALEYGVWAIFASPQTWTAPAVVTVAVVVAAALAAWLAARRPQPEGGVPASVMRVIVAVALILTATGCAVGLVAPLLAGSSEGGVNLGALATIRTCVLAIAALLIAWGARHDRLKEWAWLVYPLLVIVGLKMVAQDFKHSRPATLFIALALYGIALIVAPRLRRERHRASAAITGHGQAAQST
jgi:hypothetical protein